jgi:hypothetical protein
MLYKEDLKSKNAYPDKTPSLPNVAYHFSTEEQDDL